MEINSEEILIHGSGFAFNEKTKANGMDLLADTRNEVIPAAFFDPQYRGVLDWLSYGNEGKSRGKERSELPQMDRETIVAFIREIDRVLKKSGHLFLWVDKFHLCQEDVLAWTAETHLNVVDLITWDKERIGMGYRTRRKSEYLLILQKSPVKAKACWNDHTIPDVWREKVEKTHPHSKPIGLQESLIAAVTEPGDVVLDPAAGGFSVLRACMDTGRVFLGCDIACESETVTN